MRKYLLLLLLPALTFLNSCQKVTGVSPTWTGSTYQPVTANSYWKYTATTNGQVGNSVTTITGATATFNGKTYYTSSNTSDQYTGVQPGYFYADNHVYSLRASTLVYGVTIDMVYLNDALAVGATWTSKITDDGLVNGVPAQTIGTITESGITKTVSGKTFSNVKHSTIQLQYDYGLGSGYATYAVYDYYVAQNIGIIEIDTSISAFGLAVNSASVLTDYSIK
jgi:hypothetical protein